MSRPNLLLITSDQQRPDALGCVNPQVRTPHLDRLAADGIVFDRAYTVNPVCTPSRCTLLTGQYPSRHGCWHVGCDLPPDYQPTMPALLGEAGYYTALLGKAHFAACSREGSFEAPPHVHELDFFRGWSGPYYGFQRAQLVIGHTCETHASGMHYGAWLVDQGVDLAEHFGTHGYRDFGPWSLSAELHGSRWVADQTIDAMDRAGDQPFFLWASFQDPHSPYVVPEPWASLHDPASLDLPPRREGEMADKPPFYQAVADGRQYGDDPELRHRGWGDVAIQPKLTDDDVRRCHAAYYGMVALMDHHIGRILDALEKRGLADNTIVVFTSDHGDYLGAHRLWGKGLPAYDDAQRIPFIVRDPRCATRGARSEAYQSLVDIPHTLLSAAGVDAPPLTQGVDQTAAWRDASAKARDWAMVEFRPAQTAYCQRTLVAEGWKLVRYHRRDYGELYDMTHDPDQFENRFGDPGCREVRERLTRLFLDAEMEREGVLRDRPIWS